MDQSRAILTPEFHDDAGMLVWAQSWLLYMAKGQAEGIDEPLDDLVMFRRTISSCTTYLDERARIESGNRREHDRLLRCL